MEQQPGDHANLVQAQATIARQAEEIATLQQRLGREQFAQELRQLLISSASVNTILSPFTHSQLLEMVVQTAARVISARSGSLFLIDEEAGDLTFEVAIGPAAQEVKKFRVPLGHGFAGLVAVSGQPIAVSNTQTDERLARDIASFVNYIPESILCVPLFYDDRVIGVLELLDKLGMPSFSMTDMETLGFFANIAAVAIAQSQAYKDQQTILTGLLRAFGEHDPGRRQQLYHQAHVFSDWMKIDDMLNARARELALLVQELILSGEQECALCAGILQSAVKYTRTRTLSYTI
ncbi:MAG: GAF domain-containing protein [Chloroflexota bacterium]|nr:GAF domain-containing protein [Chloroflexota bacterium]